MTSVYYRLPISLPELTKEERVFFSQQEIDFFEKYKLRQVISLRKRIGMTLHTLAVYKLYGIYEFKKNKAVAIFHHQKACQYFPCQGCNSPIFREEVGLPLISSCSSCVGKRQILKCLLCE